MRYLGYFHSGFHHTSFFRGTFEGAAWHISPSVDHWFDFLRIGSDLPDTGSHLKFDIDIYSFFLLWVSLNWTLFRTISMHLSNLWISQQNMNWKYLWILFLTIILVMHKNIEMSLYFPIKCKIPKTKAYRNEALDKQPP